MSSEARGQIRLLGTFELQVHGQTIQLATRKTEALLAYLVLHRGVQSREKIASLFWGDSSDELARRSLRTALSALRKELGDDFFISDRETVGLNQKLSIWVDVYEMEKQARDISEANAVTGIDLELYRGDLLMDFYDEWILEEREHYRRLSVDALLRYAQSLRTSGNYPRAIAAAQKILSIDAVNERAHQHLIFCHGALGNRSAALKSYEDCVSQLQEKLGVQPTAETHQLYEHVKGANDSGTDLNLIKSNLPIPLTSFIGREQELKTLHDIFERTRLLTLTGVGGCGKTRLSIEFARSVFDGFGEVWWIEMAPIQDGTLVPQIIRKTLGIADHPDESAEESIVKFLRTRQALLVMDNCEHVLADCARLLEKILSQCADIKVLASSREAFSIPGEIAWLVPSLSVPPSDQTEGLLDWECPRLFMDRAKVYRPELQLTESNAGSLLRICHALEGIPLAIELAAARVKTLSLDQLASRLDDKLGLLTTGSRAAQQRQQTLRAAIDWSYELLSQEEQIVLQRLSVFFGTWTLEAAESVCAENGIQSAQILDLITHLLDKSLILSETCDGEILYRMLEIIRQYAREKLEQTGQAEQLSDRHARYYSELVDAVGHAWYSEQQTTLLKQFDMHSPNLRVALAWSLEDPKRTENWGHGVKLVIALVPFWNFRAELHEAQYWLEKVIAQIDTVLTESGSGLPKRDELLSIKAKASYELGALSYYLTHHAARMDLFEQAAEIYKQIEDERGLAYPNLYIAQRAAEMGQYELARRIWSESLEQFQQAGDLWYAAMVHSFFGSLACRLGNYDDGEREFHEAIALYDQVGDQWGRTIMFSHLGAAALKRGDPEKARDWYQQRLEIAQKVGFKFSQVYTTFLIGISYWASGDNHQMEHYFRQAMPYLYQIGNYATIADCLIGIAWAAAESGDFEKAAYLLGIVEKTNETFGRKVYFEYDYFNQPLCRDLRSRLSKEYGDSIARGRNADLDKIVTDLLKS